MMELVKRGVGRQEAHHKLQEYCVELRQSGESKDPVVMLSGMFNGSISSDEIRQLQKGHAGYVGMAPEFTDKVVAAFDKLATNTEDQKEKE
jgi:adenylosuccinate lyase